MPDSPNVWVCGFRELIPADRIVGVVPDRLPWRHRRNTADNAWISAKVAGGTEEDGTRKVLLQGCHASQVAAATSAFTNALAKASERSEAVLYVYPRLFVYPREGAKYPDEPEWQVNTALPPGWPQQ
jgi:hypothetical protein